MRISHVIIGILPCVESGCDVGEKGILRHEEVDSHTSRKPKKSGGKGSVALLRKSKQMGCVFQDHRATDIQVDFTEGHTILGTEAQRALRSQGTLRHVKIWKIKGPSQGDFSILNLHERSPGRNLESRAMRPQRCVGNGCTCSQAQREGQRHILLAFRRLVITSAIFDETRGKMW